MSRADQLLYLTDEQLRQGIDPSIHKGAIEGDDLPQEHVEGPTVVDQVVLDLHQVMFRIAQLQQRPAHQGRFGDVEETAHFVHGQIVGHVLPNRCRMMGQIHRRQPDRQYQVSRSQPAGLSSI